MSSPGVLTGLSELVGTSEPALRLLLTILSGYPLSLLHRHYLYGKCPRTQHIYFISTGIFLYFFNYGWDVWHSIFAVCLTYSTIFFFGGSLAAVVINFTFNMLYLLKGYSTTSTEGYDIVWTMPHCVLVLRLIGLTFDYFDGQQPIETLNAESKKCMLQERPSLLEVAGHAFFPASFLVGPQYPLRRYKSFVERSFKDGENNFGLLDSMTPAIKKLMLGVFYLAVHQIGHIYVSDEYLTSEAFVETPFLKRCFLLGLWGRITLYKYISCWLLTEGACIMFGITFNGKNENNEIQWDGCENVKLSVFENTTQFNHYIQSFNINTNLWVAQYIYKRLKFMGNKHISQSATLLFLALWHGFHSGYYMCFFMEFIIMFMEKDLENMLKKTPAVLTYLNRSPLNILINLILRVYTFIFMGFCLAPFALLSFSKWFFIYKNVYFMGLVMFLPWPVLYKPLVKFVLSKYRDDCTTRQEPIIKPHIN